MVNQLKYIAEDDCLCDVDAQAWENIVDARGGCRCFLAPPCSACVEPTTEKELNCEGYTMIRAEGVDAASEAAKEG